MTNWLITSHWTVTGYTATPYSLEHYVAVTEGGGNHVMGKFKPEDNIPPLNPGKYAAGTGGNNSYNINLAMAAMEGAEWADDHADVEFGPSPITEYQFEEHCKLIAVYAEKYQIPVVKGRIDTHAEVEANRGKRQKGKWDTAFLKWRPDLEGASAVGDFMRSRVSFYLAQTKGGAHLAEIKDIPANRPTVRFGDRGHPVKLLQLDMLDLKYFTGMVDGHFGQLTRGGVLAFQADNNLTTDGIAGPRTYAVMASAKPREPRRLEMADLDSGTVRNADLSDRVADLSLLGGGAKIVTDVQSAASDVQSTVVTAQGAADGALSLWQTVQPYWPIAVLVLGYLVWRGINHSTKLRRLDDAKNHRHIGPGTVGRS